MQFNHKPANPDTDLKVKLAAEYPAILRWMLDGCLAWQRDRLGTCDAVASASAGYFAEQDVAALWAAERCVMGPEKEMASLLLADFNQWSRSQGRTPVNSSDLKKMLARLPGVISKHTEKGAAFMGIALRKPENGGTGFAGLYFDAKPD